MAKQPLKVKLTENDINKIIHSVLFNLKESFDNPFTIPEKLRNNLLMEGYFKTYPAEDILKYLSNRYGEYASIQLLENKNGVKVFSISFYNDSIDNCYFPYAFWDFYKLVLKLHLYLYILAIKY